MYTMLPEKHNRINVRYMEDAIGSSAKRIRRIRVIAGESIEESVRRAFPKLTAKCFSVDGGLVPRDYRITGKERIIDVWTPPTAPALALVTTFVASMVIGGAISALTRKKTRTKFKKQLEDVSDIQYGWDYDAKNAADEGAPVPVLYGTRMVTPPVIHRRNFTDEYGDSFFVSLFLVADGGSGFGDNIFFPADENGRVVAKINHADWTNYVSDSLSGGTTTSANRLFASGSPLANVYINYGASGGTLAPHMNNGNTAFFDISENGGAAVISELAIKGLNNIWFNLPTAIFPTKVKLFSHYEPGIAQAATKFSLYALDGDEYVLLGTTTSLTNSGTEYCLTLNLPVGEKRYSTFLLQSFDWKRKWVGGMASSYGRMHPTEVEIYGESSLSVTTMGGYADVDVSPGSFDQQPFESVDGTWASLSVNKTLDEDWFVFSTTRKAYPDRIALQLEFPYGLYATNSGTGEVESKSVKVAAQRRTVADDGTTGPWVNFNSDFSSGYMTITGQTTSAKKVYVESPSLGGGASHYQVRVKFYENPGPTSDNAVECIWNGLDEGWDFLPAYVRSATASMKLLATKALSGSPPKFEIKASRGVVNIWNPITSLWEEKDATNPAWATWDVLVRPRFDDSVATGNFSTNTIGALVRENFDHGRMIYSEFAEWAQFCEEEGITISMYFDGSMTVRDAIEYILEVGRASLISRGNLFGVAIDRKLPTRDENDAPVPSFIFDESNVVANSYKVSYRPTADLPNAVEVTFFDRDREWQRFTVIARDDQAELADVEPKTVSITLHACDRRDVAEKHAEYVLGKSMIKRVFEWTGDMDSIPLDIGDVVRVYDDLVTITSASLDEEMRRRFTGIEYVDARFN